MCMYTDCFIIIMCNLPSWRSTLSPFLVLGHLFFSCVYLHVMLSSTIRLSFEILLFSWFYANPCMHVRCYKYSSTNYRLDVFLTSSCRHCLVSLHPSNYHEFIFTRFSNQQSVKYIPLKLAKAYWQPPVPDASLCFILASYHHTRYALFLLSLILTSKKPAYLCY